uniref:Reverse transcriptase domain-containing protein n=1 Tax=Micrurus spixii TaxID=129469 RepID=A0A2D4MIZ3_9SAUR
MEVYNDTLLRAELTKSWSEAYITLIPKEDTNRKNYRPISLLRVDYKILASITAVRLKGFLNECIHHDQNGFLAKRQLTNNMRIIMNVLEYYEAHPEKQLALAFLDAQNRSKI